MEETFWTSKKFLVVAIACVVAIGVLILSIEAVRSSRARTVLLRHPDAGGNSLASNAPVSNSFGDPSTFAKATEDKSSSNSVGMTQKAVVHIPLPSEVRGMYWTAVTASSKRGDELIDYMQKTGLNTVVIDLKMDDGELAFTPHDASLSKYAQRKPAIQDLDGLLDKLGVDHIYRIARIAVMRDSAFASVRSASALKASGGLWRDKTGVAWVDPAAPDVATYALALAREAYARGFDEVQFDYVRFASDGKIASIAYPFYNGKDLKVDVMKKFFAAVGAPLRADHIPVSFDVFGLICMTNDGLGIGQRLDGVLASADFVSPMMYPSHYANGFQGFANPATHPYDVIKISLDHALGLLNPPKIEMSSVKNADGSETVSKKTISPTKDALATTANAFRPWIQDFDIGAVYTGSMIEAQIKAVRDAGGSGFLIWNARNVYEPAKYTP